MYNMVHLIRKDFLLLKRYLLIIGIYALAFSSFIQTKLDMSPLFGLFPGMVLILVLNSDIRLPNQQFLVNLPIRRSYLVKSKYVSAFIFTVLSLAFCIILSNGIDMLNSRPVSWNFPLIFGIFIVQVFFVTIYLPLYYWLGLKGAQFLNIAMMILIMAGSQTVTGILSSEDAAGLVERIGAHPYASGVLGIGTVLLMVVVSYLISRSIFLRRDL